jgi:hypothetical protein
MIQRVEGDDVRHAVWVEAETVLETIRLNTTWRWN